MEYRTLGRTGVKVSPLCMGTGTFTRLEQQSFTRLLGESIDMGLNFLDTANIYGGKGRDEEMIGRALKDLGCRDRMIVATKFSGSMHETDPNAQGFSRRHIIEQCEQSLRRLQTDWIDLYQLHCSCGCAVPVDEPLRALDDLIRAGKVRYIGTSHFAAWQLMESMWVSRALGLNRFVCEQTSYHPLDRTAERELLPFAQTYGLAVILWSPLANGFLTGKYERGTQKLPFWRVLQAGEAENARMVDRAFAVVEALIDIARSKGCTPAQFVLAWELAQPGITCPIIGYHASEQLRENLGALDVSITDNDRARVDAVARPGQAVVAYNDTGLEPPLNADWGPHSYRW